ncbi:MAG TPA: YtxH domain-containing protein [Candidatus Saccharimonadales bacterium]|nr:YtxH domain-containing protein [Candidatus Saccharimonadales bacterium]
MGKTAKRFALGTLFAAAAGYIAGILTAPKSGKETRADIKETANKSVNEAEKQLKKLHTELNKVINQAKGEADSVKGKAREEVDAAIAKTMAVKEKARQVLSALHEGDADDKDLEKAIKEATKAIDHLKSFAAKK